MLKEAIYHESFGVNAYPLSADTINLRLRTAKNDIQECYVYYIEKYDFTPNLLWKKMSYFVHDDYFAYFTVAITLTSKRFKYFFKLIDHNGEELFYVADRFDHNFPENTLYGGYFQFPYINDDDLPEYPTWAKQAIFYQIFPDRFYRGGEKTSDKRLQSWGTKPKRNSFFGGNIRGIIEKLDYLKELGVNVLYITPLWLSDSNHKYNIIDYYTIDPDFGTKEELKELVTKAHQEGIKIVLDAVFNHCSNKHPFFLDVVAKGEDSPYFKWFYINGGSIETDPVPNYETFGVNISNMPRLNSSHPEVKEYLLGVAEYWLRELDIDGWRLDVSDEVAHSFWKEFRNRLKAIKKDVFIIGEVWHQATPWLMGDEFDSVMNYPFRKAVLDFFVTRSADREDFINSLNKNFINYKDETPYYLLNLLGSHDTARFLTLCNDDFTKMRLAMIFMMTFVGIPMIYYGDEIGIDGSEDPDCRKTMIWDEKIPEPAALELFTKLIKIRKANAVLVEGRFKPIRLTENKKVLSYLRDDGQKRAVIIINNSDSAVSVELRKELFNHSPITDCLHEKEYNFNEEQSLKLNVDKRDAVILSSQ